MKKLTNRRIEKPDVHIVAARKLLRYIYTVAVNIAARIVERREHSDEMKAFVSKLAVRTVLPVGRLDELQGLREIVVLREMKGVEHRLKLHPGSTFRQIYQKAREVLKLPACKSSPSLSLFYSENLLGASRRCTWEALAQVPCHDCLCSILLGGTVLCVVTYSSRPKSYS